MFSEITFNLDESKLLIIGVALMLMLKYFIPKLWKIIDRRSFNENEHHIKKALAVLNILFILGLMLFAVFNGYESTHKQADMGTEAITTEARKFVAPTIVDIEAEEAARELKKKLKEETRINKEKEESKRVYEEALNN